MAKMSQPSRPVQEGRGEVVVVVDGGATATARAFASELRARVDAGVGRWPATVLLAIPTPEIALVDPAHPLPEMRMAPDADLARGGVAGNRSALGAVLREVDRRSAAGAALVVGSSRDESVDWLSLLLSPILESGFEFVCPTYRRGRFEGLIGTGILYPITRALYGLRLRQPAGGEVALSQGLARHLLADGDWQRDPEHAGSDAWLVAKVLSEGRPACQAWLGRWPGEPHGPGDASRALARVVGPVFREMERHVDRWQRVEGSTPPTSIGQPGATTDTVDVDVAALVRRFRLGLRELEAIWGLVLSPTARLSLQRAATAPPDDLHLDDALWARVVYDFAVAHTTRVVDRSQLLHSMTPLYLGWVAGFANDVRGRDDRGVEARVEALCAAFEREKPYLIARWRWPDSFNP